MKTKNTDLSWNKSRSTGSVANAAFKLMANNFKKIFRFTWLPALIGAIVGGIMIYFTATYAPKTALSLIANPLKIAPTYLDYIWTLVKIFGSMAGCALVYGLFCLFIWSCSMRLLADHMETAEMKAYLHVDRTVLPHYWRMLKSTLLSFLIIALPISVICGLLYKQINTIASAPAEHPLTFGLSVVATIAYLIFSLPICYIWMYHLTHRDSAYFKSFGKQYATGLSHLGIIFGTLFVSVIIVGFVGFVLNLPAIILALAYNQSLEGQFIGDPSGMPGGLGWIAVSTISVIIFINAYLHLLPLYSIYFMQGSIQQQEEDKKKYKAQQNNLDFNETNTIYRP